MDIYSWTFLILRPLLALGAFICIPRSLLPIKTGWRNEDQKSLTKGSVLLIFGVVCLVFFFVIMSKG